MIVNGPDNQRYDVPADATDAEILSLFGEQPAKAPGVWDTVKEAAKGAVKNTVGIAENVANQVTQLGAMTVSAIPNIIGSAGAELADAVVNERMPTFKGVGDKFHANLEPQIYQPQTDSGKRQVEATGKVMTAIPAVVDAIDEATGDTFKRNMPNTYAATQVAGEFLPWIVGGKALHSPGQPSVMPRNVKTIPEAELRNNTVPLEELPPEQPRAEAPKQEAPRQEAPRQESPQPEPSTEPVGQPNYTSKQEPASPERITHEIALTQDPATSKAAMMMPDLGAEGGKFTLQAAKESGLKPLKENGSYYLFNPEQTTAVELRAAIKNGTEGNLLGYSTDAVPPTGIDYAVSVDGRGTVDLPTIKQWRDNNQLGFAGRALDAEMATAKMQEMGAKQIEAPMHPTPMSERVAPADQQIVDLPTNSLKVDMTHLRIADENIAKSKPPINSSEPVDVHYNVDTGEYSLTDGYHRYLQARGGSIESALSQARSGVFPTIKAKITLVKNDKIGEFDTITKVDTRTAPDAPQAPVAPLEAKAIEPPSPEPAIQKEPLNIQPDVVDTPMTFERLAPAGRRGAAVSYKVNMSPSQHTSLREVRQEVSDGMAGDRVGIYNTNEPGFTNIAWGSSFPEYFKDKGLTKKEVLPVLDRIINNEAVTEKQWLMAEDLLKAKRYDTLNQVLNKRAEIQSERVSVNDAEWSDRLQAAEDYFQQRGGFDEITEAPIGEVRADEPAGAGRVYQPPVGDNAKPEAPRVETIDGSGWGQQVAPELQGDKKAVQFGDKKPTGRNVGLSEFMDGFDEPQKDLFSSRSHADTGGYSDRPSAIRETTQTFLEQPEMLKLAKAINEGKIPKLMERMGNALGRFTHRADGEASIKLRKDLFAGPRIAAESMKTKDARAGWEAWQKSVQDAHPDTDIIFRQKFNRKTGNVDFKAYKRDPNYVLKTFAHEIGHNVDYIPDSMVKGRGNILGHVAALKRYLKHTMETPEGKYSKNEMTNELKTLTQKWKPFDDTADPKYTKYRYSSAELYADATSVLFNEPQLLKDTAPTFYKAFFYHMGERPAFKEAYTAISRMSKDPQALGKDRYAEEMGMYRKGNEKAEEIRKAEKPSETIYNTAMRWLIDKNHNVLKDIPDTKAGREARHIMEEIPYIAGEAENYVRKADNIKKEVEAAGATVDDLSAYMLAKHIISNRDGIANTLGKTAATEKAKLDWMQQNLGAEKYAALEKAADEFRKTREHILTRMEEAGIVTPELLEKIKGNQDYAHIDVQAYMDQKYGQGTAAGAGWKKMAEGTLEDINNVYTATVLQDISIMRMAKINEAKRGISDIFTGEGLAKQAQMKFDPSFKGMRPVEPGGDQAILTVLQKGKPAYYVVDRHVVEMFQHDPVQALRIGKAAGLVQTFFRDILVSKNPAWMARNLFRDFKGTVKNNPEVSFWNPMDRLRLLKAYKAGFSESRADVFHGKRSADIETMHNEHMLNSDRMYSAKEESFDNPLERIAIEFQFGEQESANRAVRGLKALYNYADKMGKVSEQTGKIAGMKFLRDKGLDGNDLSHRVRTRIGTPDYKRQGSLQQLTNNLFMFSNVNKEGVRSAVEAFKHDPISYTFKTVEANILPKLALMAAGQGLFGDDLKDIVKAIPSWVKRSYNVIPLPGAFTEWAAEKGIASAKDAGYLKLPSDYEGQFFGALTYDLSEGEYADAFSDIVQQMPWTPAKIHPALKLAGDYMKYASGETPKDTFRKKDVLTKEQQKYLEVEGVTSPKALKGMALHSYNMLGLGNVYRLENKEFPKQKAAEEAVFKQIMRYTGGFVEFSDAGKQEQMVKGIIETRNQKALKSYEAGDQINEAIRSGKDKPGDIAGVYKALIANKTIDPAKTRYGTFRARYLNTIMQRDYGIKPSSKAEQKVLRDFAK